MSFDKKTSKAIFEWIEEKRVLREENNRLLVRVAELESARLAPDPRVAVLEAIAAAAKTYLADLRWNTQVEYENRHTLITCVEKLALVAAQRGEVEG